MKTNHGKSLLDTSLFSNGLKSASIAFFKGYDIPSSNLHKIKIIPSSNCIIYSDPKIVMDMKHLLDYHILSGTK